MDTKGKILVIDNELGIREGCTRALKPQGYIVETAETLQEGLNKIQEGKFDLVLLDVMMPDGRGIDLLAPIAERDPDVVIVIITGYATVELAAEAIKRGAYDFISKPFTSDLLLMTVNQGLEKRRLSLEAKRLQAIEQEAVTLAREKDEMERLNRFKTDFMLMVAHELRSPVGSAQSLIRTLIRGLAGGLNEQQGEILTRIEARLSVLTELINDLLSFAESKSYDVDQPLERVSINQVIERVIDHYMIEAENKHLKLTYEIPEDILAVKATEDGLQKIIGNLIGNAIKYTPEGGSVQVEVLDLSENVEIKVSDTGIGIPEEDLPRLGDEFFRAKNAKRLGIVGTGLGLSIVTQLVDRFGGSIVVHSVEGEGTAVKLKLPLGGLPSDDSET
jgi:signal transduction histidine kinase